MTDYDKGFAAGIKALREVFRGPLFLRADQKLFDAAVDELLPTTEPTCARCGGKRHVRTAPAKDGASFMMPCPDCSKPETPPTEPGWHGPRYYAKPAEPTCARCGEDMSKDIRDEMPHFCMKPETPRSRKLAEAATKRTIVPDEAWAARLAADSVAAGECETPPNPEAAPTSKLAGGWHTRPDGKLCNYESYGACNKCGAVGLPEAAPDAYLRGYRNGIEATRSGAVDSATILHPEVAPAAQWGPMMGPPIAVVAAPVCATCEGVDCENSSGYCSLCNRPWRTKAT